VADVEEEMQPIGAILDALGVAGPLDKSERITDVVVFAKVTNFETGDMKVSVYLSDDTDFVTVAGLMDLGRQAYEAIPLDEE
jgi:hypothetical protein